MGDITRIGRGCLFCRTGKESAVIRRIALYHPGIQAMTPYKTRYRREGGRLREESVPLLRGYVFYQTDRDVNLRELSRVDDVLRPLTYENGEWRLHGSDDEFARLLFQADGHIGLSMAYFDEGNRIRILEGFLKEYEGSIVRVNRRSKTAEVRLDFQDKEIRVWLGFELMERADAGEQKKKCDGAT